MNNNFREQYKVELTQIEKSYQHQVGLKNNEEYENLTSEACEKILNYFSELYKGVSIEIPKEREKSHKSLLGKIKNLQIERLSKLSTIEGINEKEKQQLYDLLKERVYESNKGNKDEILLDIKSILNDDLEQLNIKKIEKDIIINGFSNSTKTALLRMIIGKIEKSNVTNKEELIRKLDEKYGEEAAKKTKIPENDIIKYSSIRDIRENSRRMAQLHDEDRYLKAKDLRGMKIIIIDVPEKLETDNERLKELLKKRKTMNYTDEKTQNNHLCSIEIGKDFFNKLINNQELLKSIGIEVMPFSIKYKKKTNGYEADHIKFQFVENPDYTFELQIKSEYIEELTKGNGTAAHENRPGKTRIFPKIEDEKKFINEIQYLIPKYSVFVKTNEGFKRRKCNILENTMSYFQNHLEPESQEYEDTYKILDNYMKKSEKII